MNRLRTVLSLVRRAVTRYRWQLDYEQSLNRRSEVEQHLWNAYNGKVPLPDKETCKNLAQKLGVPESWTGKPKS